MIEGAFEEQWRAILGRAKDAKAAYESAVADDMGSKMAAKKMYAANSAVRRFCDMERQLLQQTPGV